MKWVARKRPHLTGLRSLETTPEWLDVFRDAVETERARRIAAGEGRPAVQRELAKAVGCEESIISALLSRKPPKHCRFIDRLSEHYGLPLPQYKSEKHAALAEDVLYLMEHDPEAFDLVFQMAAGLARQTRARGGRRSG